VQFDAAEVLVVHVPARQRGFAIGSIYWVPRYKFAKRGRSSKARPAQASSPRARAGRRRRSGCLVVSVLMILATALLLAILI
jgi:hypothetical protein